MHVQVGVQRARAGQVVGLDPGLRREREGRVRHLGVQRPFAAVGQAVQGQARHGPAPGGERERQRARRRPAGATELEPAGQRQVAAGVAPGVVQPNQRVEVFPAAHQSRRDHLERDRRPGDDVEQAVARHLGELGASERVDEHAEAEVLLHEALHPRAGAAVTAIAEADHDAVARVQVAVDDVDQHGLLERPLVALLVEAHFQVLHRRRALSGHQRAGLVFGRDEVGRARVGGLEQRPVGVELERQLEPGAVGQAGGAHLVGQHQLGPLAGHQLAPVAMQAAQEGQCLVALVESARGGVVAGFPAGVECVGHVRLVGVHWPRQRL